jgi:hypothetical protein
MYCSGPWFRYLADYLILSPLVFLLAAGFFFHRLASGARDDALSYFMLLAVFLLAAFGLFAKNIRYVMLADMPLRLFAVMMLVELCGRFFPGKADRITAALVLALAVSDYIAFRGIFVEGGVYDPVSFHLLRALRFIPGP